uniref:CCN TSP1 domain-containing protein n=1 Tax=Cuerna arida TaxID=1464854 RepID=A0A1B6GHM2_9HEMI
MIPKDDDNDDDDDDDDGGEYEGLDYSNGNNGLLGKKKDCKESVPMMIIREVDMVAMQIPVRDKDKDKIDQKDKNGQQWSEWSPCSKPCGDGLQSRWRLQPFSQDKEQQVRICHVADCPGGDPQLGPSLNQQYYNKMVMN